MSLEPFNEEALPRGLGAPLGRARLRTEPADFVVEEELGFSPQGEGEHVLLYLRKRGLTTRDVARRLSSLAAVRENAIGYCGLKDRHAETSQWFSVHLPGQDGPDWSRLENEELQVLERARHPRKLRRAQHRGNRFRLRLRQLVCERQALAERLQALASQGAPNYFGAQRFGNAGDNVLQALAMFRGERVRRGPLRGLLLSAARSHLFNTVVAERVRRASWARLLSGDVLLLTAENRLLGDRPLDEPIETAYAAGRVDASAVLWGRGGLLSRGEMREIESSAAQAMPELAAGLEAAGLGMQRRALRLWPAQLDWEYDGADLQLHFALPVGSYATSLVREIAITTEGPTS